jgi:hypothetical protein
MKKCMAMVLVVATLAATTVSAQAGAQPDVWRAFAQRIDAGSRVRVSLDDGQRVVATLIDAGEDGLLLQPRTRLPVPLQRIAYDRIVSIERDKPRGGIGAGKAIAIGVASGVGAFLGTLIILIATID